MSDKHLCPLCHEEVFGAPQEINSAIFYNCNSRCGKVSIHKEFKPEEYQEHLHTLSGWIRKRTDKNEDTLTTKFAGNLQRI